MDCGERHRCGLRGPGLGCGQCSCQAMGRAGVAPSGDTFSARSPAAFQGYGHRKELQEMMKGGFFAKMSTFSFLLSYIPTKIIIYKVRPACHWPTNLHSCRPPSFSVSGHRQVWQRDHPAGPPPARGVPDHRCECVSPPHPASAHSGGRGCSRCPCEGALQLDSGLRLVQDRHAGGA